MHAEVIVDALLKNSNNQAAQIIHVLMSAVVAIKAQPNFDVADFEKRMLAAADRCEDQEPVARLLLSALGGKPPAKAAS